MNPATFQLLAGMVKQRSGGVLTADQDYMLDTRLAPLLKREGLLSLDALAMRLRNPGSGRGAENLAQEMTELLTNNESHFFRDGKPFEHLQSILPTLHRARPAGAPIRIWSAACSTGQEAYSIAILLTEAQEAEPEMKSRRFEIVGTDLAASVVERAREAEFTQFEVQRGLQIRQLLKHFTQIETRWRAKEHLRVFTRFQQANLLQDQRSLGQFDVIFCRNVLIYLDLATKTRVLSGIAGQLASDGALYLGAAETALGVTDRLEPILGQRAVYRPAESEPVRARA